jgi:hypothetical protein
MSEFFYTYQPAFTFVLGVILGALVVSIYVYAQSREMEELRIGSREAMNTLLNKIGELREQLAEARGR